MSEGMTVRSFVLVQPSQIEALPTHFAIQAGNIYVRLTRSCEIKGIVLTNILLLTGGNVATANNLQDSDGSALTRRYFGLKCR